MLIKRMCLLLLALSCALTVGAQDKNEELFAAARKGDATALKALLDKGIDVNAKTHYGATALSYACEKGHAEVVKLLIERGADVNAQDTFYGEIPLGWASGNGHIEIVKLLLDKGARPVDRVLRAGVNQGNVAMVKLALEKGGATKEALTIFLARATRQNKTEIVELLKKADAKLPPSVPVDEQTLMSYAGFYKSELSDLLFSVKAGRLVGGTPGQDPVAFSALSANSFSMDEAPGITVVFSVEGGKVTGLVYKQANESTVYRKVEQK